MRLVFAAIASIGLVSAASVLAADSESATIARIKPSIVAIGTYERSRSPAFVFRGTGFAVGDGTRVVTNAHVLPAALDAVRKETLVVLVPVPATTQGQVRAAQPVAVDPETDLAVLATEGAPLPALTIGDSDGVKEGQRVLFTGFPIGGVLGAFAATHQGMVAAVTPIAIPQGRSTELDAKVIRRLASGTFPVFQLDATAYPGNSGSPLYDPQTGAVLGVVNMVFVKSTKESVLTQPSGIAYAIPARHVRALLDKAR